MPAHEMFPVEQIIDGIRRARGVKTVASRIIGCDRKTIDNYERNHESVKEAIYEARQEFLDQCELTLIDAVNKGDLEAVKFALRYLGQARGYQARLQVSADGGGPAQAVLISAVTVTVVHERPLKALPPGQTAPQTPEEASYETVQLPEEHEPLTGRAAIPEALVVPPEDTNGHTGNSTTNGHSVQR